MNRYLSVLVVALVATGGAAMQAAAQAPQIINYQGRLLLGTNLVNGNVGLSLRLFNLASGGTRLYEDSNTVTVVDGLYSTFIGDNTTYGEFYRTLGNAQLWIEVAVNNTALTPRERLASVAYAQRVAGLHIGTNGFPSSVIHPQWNAMNDLASGSAIGGGLQNYIEAADEATIAGGRGNIISSNANYSVIGGGQFNVISTNAGSATIAGGIFNLIETNSSGAAIGGGGLSQVGHSSPYAVIGGGYQNRIFDRVEASVIVGGDDNWIQSGSTNAFIGGGYLNIVRSNTAMAVIGGGYQNRIRTRTTAATIGGGYRNEIGEASDHAFIGGGADNDISTNATHAFIGGGAQNVISNNAFYSTVGAGNGNSIGPSSGYSFIGGGYVNAISSNTSFGVIGGGVLNEILSSNNAATIAGGYQNLILANTLQSTIGGGLANVIESDADKATIPGGLQNRAGGARSFAAGNRAHATNDGTFVWSDNSSSSPFRSTGTNQFLVRATGGVGINTNQPGAALHVAGEAMIGSVANPAKFGMTVVHRTSSGILFTHPADTNLNMSWNSTAKILSVTNSANHFYDCTMQLTRETNSVILAVTDDIATPGLTGTSISLTNNGGFSAAGWTVSATREQIPGPGFQFTGNGFGVTISGLIIYWY